MAAAAFDTMEFIETLKRADIPEEQAKAISTAVRDAYQTANLATKEDLEKLETGLQNELEKLSLRLTIRLGSIVVAGVTVIGIIFPTVLKLLHVF